MTTKKLKTIKLILLMLVLGTLGTPSSAQSNGYLMNRVKPGDIFYLDTEGHECFLDYRQWDQDNPPGTAQGVVYYSYYGKEPCDSPDGEPGWHGWIVALDESDPLCWAPENTICYDSCVALYPVEGINTPWNPRNNPKEFAVRDTCGWQNTYRLLEFIYTKNGSILSEDTSPAFLYIFTEKNGVEDFSVKPVMSRSSWYLPAYGQLRYLYGNLGCVNAALASCGGILFTTKQWCSSSEVGDKYLNAIWNLSYYGTSSINVGWNKDLSYNIRAIRNF